MAGPTTERPADAADHECLLLGNGVIHVLNAGRGTTPPCPEALHKVGDVVKVRRLKHLKHLPERAAVVIVVPPHFSPEFALADAKGEPRPLMVTVPYKTVSYICAFEGNPKPYLIRERDLIATGEKAEVGFEETAHVAR